MVVDFVPVVVEGDALPRTLKLRAPANMTAAQFLHGIRSRTNLGGMQACHLVSEKGFAMSQKMADIYRDNKSENGLLHLTFATESAFGCPLPPKSPLENMFNAWEAALTPSPPPPTPPFDPWQHYQQWLHHRHQQQEAMIQAANDYIAQHHNPHSVGAVYHVVHSQEGGSVVLYQAEGGTGFHPVQLVDTHSPPW